jgi:hypothetical protein
VTDFAKLLGALTEGQVRFIVVGGAAATAHGSARLTLDLDIVYERTEENVDRLIAALGPGEPYLRSAPRSLPFQWTPKTIRNGLNFTLATTWGDIDLLGEISGGGGYAELLPYTIMLDLFGHKCECLNLERLIFVKRAAGRPKDFDAVAELEAIQEQSIDSDE